MSPTSATDHARRATGAGSRFLRRFAGDRGGVSAIEFAFIAPILIIFYFGMAETCQLLMAKRKISHAGAAVADLVSQTQLASTSTTELSDVLLAGKTIVSPFPAGPSVLKIQLISATARNPTAGGDPMVDWSYPAGGPAKDATVKVSTPLNAGESVIMAEVTYGYSSPIGYFIPGVKTLTHKAELRPRKQDQIACSDCV